MTVEMTEDSDSLIVIKKWQSEAKSLQEDSFSLQFYEAWNGSHIKKELFQLGIERIDISSRNKEFSTACYVGTLETTNSTEFFKGS